LSLTNDSHWMARSGFPPYRYMVCVAHHKEAPPNILEGLLVSLGSRACR